jgi:hypothetical protein
MADSARQEGWQPTLSGGRRAARPTEAKGRHGTRRRPEGGFARVGRRVVYGASVETKPEPTPGWAPARARAVVSRTLEEIAADYPDFGSPFDAASFHTFDLELSAAFAAEDIVEVEMLCKWYRDELLAASRRRPRPHRPQAIIQRRASSDLSTPPCPLAREQ